MINAEGKPTDIYEWEHYNNNVERWYSIRDRAIPWHDGHIVRLEIAMDITENKNNEVASMRLLNTIEASLNEIYMFDAETYRFVYVNHGALQNIGYTEEKMKSMTPLDIIPELDESTFNDLIAPLVQNEKEIIEFNTMHKRADGSMYPVEVHLQLIRNDEVPMFLAIILDITERKQAEENLIHSHYLMQYIISHAQNAIAVHDRDLKYLYVSEQHLKQYNVKEKDIIGKHHYDVFPDLPQKWKDVHQKALAGEVSSKDEDPYEREDGSVDWTRWECRPWYEADGSIGGIIVYTEVITERMREKEELLKYRDHLEELVKERTDEIQSNKQALVNIVEDLNLTTEDLKNANDRLLELDLMKSMFIASTSHELRTPLNSIIGFTSVLLEGWSGELNPEQKEQLGIVLTSGKYLLSLINDVIDISKIEAGKLEVYIEQFSFLDMVKEASSLIKPDIEGKGLTLTVDVPDIMIDTDRRRLLQCIINLLSNAIKFTEKGGITIKAKTINNVIDISISDTGIGIKSEDLRKLFKAFVRLESPLTDKTSGTGLGLYLTYKLVHEVLGGTIDATSKHGEGSTFTLHIPITQEVQK
ncbi:MAG: PAS domain S-box protein [Methanosarcinaceae archaeon]|nr:PAS domain S-box protein [Methanosarcinaceae archaeon]